MVLLIEGVFGTIQAKLPDVPTVPRPSAHCTGKTPVEYRPSAVNHPHRTFGTEGVADSRCCSAGTLQGYRRDRRYSSRPDWNCLTRSLLRKRTRHNPERS